MANIMFSPKFRVEDSTGAPLVGGKAYFYVAGGATPKDTYADAGAVTTNANPVILDSRGEATVYGVGSYKIVIKDAADATVYTVDNYKVSGTVDTADITDGAVTTPKLAANVLSADTTGRAKMQDGFVTSAKLDTAGVALASGSTAVTQAAGDSTTKVATTAYVQGEFTDKAATQANMEAQAANKFVTADKVKYSPGATKAWLYLNGTGTPAIVASYGIASITDDGVGLYTITFSTAFSSANYCVIGNASSGAGVLYFVGPNIAPTATGVQIAVRNGSGALVDVAYIYVAFFGDL